MKIRRSLVRVIVVTTALFGLNVAIVAPAQATTTYIYPVYHYQVCQRQGHFGASYYNPWNAGSWYCYDLSIPIGVTWAGGLDINGWCVAKYRGSHAELTANNVWGWRCVKRV